MRSPSKAHVRVGKGCPNLKDLGNLVAIDRYKRRCLHVCSRYVSDAEKQIGNEFIIPVVNCGRLVTMIWLVCYFRSTFPECMLLFIQDYELWIQRLLAFFRL